MPESQKKKRIYWSLRQTPIQLFYLGPHKPMEIQTRSFQLTLLALTVQGLNFRVSKQDFDANLSHGEKKSKWSHRDVPVLIRFPSQLPNPGMKIKPQTQISSVVTNKKKKKCPLPLPPRKKKKPSELFQTQLVNVTSFSE